MTTRTCMHCETGQMTLETRTVTASLDGFTQASGRLMIASASDGLPSFWVLARGMQFSSHHDAPVAFPDSMRILSATVTRRSRTGDIIGPAHRVDVITALKAMTIWPAFQHFEEDRKGSLVPGKLAFRPGRDGSDPFAAFLRQAAVARDTAKAGNGPMVRAMRRVAQTGHRESRADYVFRSKQCLCCTRGPGRSAGSLDGD